jgi:hypothetical protein
MIPSQINSPPGEISPSDSNENVDKKKDNISKTKEKWKLSEFISAAYTITASKTVPAEINNK